MKNKIDKGFCFSYWRLSYRRRFLRTLWMTPLVLLVPFYAYAQMRSVSLAVVVALVLLIVYGLQLTWNYRAWKREEQDEASGHTPCG